jgi:hypothetical protein
MLRARMSEARGAPAPALDLRPLDMGELVDRSTGLWRRHLRELFRLQLGFSLVLYALGKGVVLSVARWSPLFLGGEAFTNAVTSRPEEVLRQLPAALGLFSVYFVLSGWVNWQGWVAVSDFAVGRWLQRDVSVEGSLRRALRRASASSGAFAIATLYVLASTTVFMLPGAGLFGLILAAVSSPVVAGVLGVVGAVLVALGGLAGILWCVLRFLLTCQVLAVEDVSGLQAIRRSGRLISGRVGPGFLGWVKVRATILVTVVALMVLVVMLVSGLPSLVVQVIYGNLLDPAHATPQAIPQGMLVPAELIEVLVQSAFSPLYIAFAALFYADMRVRREGLDLELALAREAA